MNSKVTYHQQVTYCGKPRCRRCREGIGHGPYWYAYQTVDGQTIRTYIGKNLPTDAQAAIDAASTSTGGSTLPSKLSSSSSSSSPLASLRPSSPADPGAAALSISTLGQFRLERHSQPGRRSRHDSSDTNWQQRSVRTLLGYLLCCPERRASRDQIRTALWREIDDASARSLLSKAANALRKVLGHPTVEGGQEPQAANGWLFQTDNEELALGPQERVWVDADAFDACVGRLRSDHSQNGEQREQALREAIALYRGDFLIEEREAEWVVTRRQELRHSWIELQLETADLCVQREDFAATIKVLDTLLAKDPTNEAAIQRLVIVLARSRRRIEALHAYKRFEEALQREYKALPAPDTRALFDMIRQGRELPFLAKSSSDQGDVAQTQTSDTVRTSPPDSSVDGPSVSPVDARVHRLFASASNLENSMRPHQGALIGRDSELGLMQKMLYDVGNLAGRRNTHYPPGMIPLDTQRRPQFLFLMGDSGIGKTRLAEEVSREGQQRGWAVIWSRLYEQEGGIPYRAWTEALRKLLNMSSSLLSPENVQPLATLLPELAEVVPYVLRGKVVPSYALTPEQERQRLWDAIVNLLKEMSDSTPLLLVLDDIQWADSSSHDLLGYLVRHLYGYPIMFVSTCRDSALPTDPHHPLRELVSHMQRERNIQTLKIEPLTTEQIGQLVTNLSPLPEETIKHIKDYAAGNPFFAEEMARTTPPTLPQNVTDALGYRMKRLSSDCRGLLGRAAVLGGSFEFPLICAMESRGDLDDEETVLTLLEEALQEGVLTDEGSGTRVTYHFWHPLMVSYLYDDLSTVRRARLHQRAADAFLSTYHGREESVAATVTDHLEKAGAAPARIAHYAELAGNNAYMVSAYSEAAYYYKRAVDYLPSDAQLQLVSLLERLAECTRIRGHYPEARQLYERVLNLRRQNQALTTDSKLEAQVQALLWDEIAWTWRYTGDIARAWECFREGEYILRVADVVGGPAWGRLYYTQSNLYQAEGHYDQALTSAEAALVLLEAPQTYQKQALAQSSRSSGKGQIQRTLEGDPVNLGRTYRHMGTIAVAMGQLSQALAHQRKALALYEQYDEMRQIAHVTSNIGHIYLKKAEYVQAQAALRRSINLAEHINDDPLISLIYYNQAELAAATGDLEEAENLYRSALDLEERFQDLEYISKWNSGLAAIVQERGKLPEAVRCIKRALYTGRKMQNDPCIGYALVALGNLRITQALSAGCTGQRQHHLLSHGQTDLRRALALNSLDVETRLRGQLAQAHIALVLNDRDAAFSALEQVIAEAQRHELAQIVARALQLQSTA